MSQSPVVALYLAHLEQRSGLLEILSGAHSTRIHLQRGRVVQVEDMPGLLEELVPHGIGSLRDDLAKAIQGGAPMPQAFETAARDIGRALALTHGQDGVEANYTMWLRSEPWSPVTISIHADDGCYYNPPQLARDGYRIINSNTATIYINEPTATAELAYQ